MRLIAHREAAIFLICRYAEEAIKISVLVYPTLNSSKPGQKHTQLLQASSTSQLGTHSVGPFAQRLLRVSLDLSQDQSCISK